MPDWIAAFTRHGAISFAVEFARYLIAASAMTVVIWMGARWTASRKIQARRATLGDRAREFRHSMMTVAMFGGWSMLILALNRAGIVHMSFSSPTIWQAIVEFAVIVFAHDAYFYWMHRWLHLKSMFRRAHLTHHKSRTPTPWAAYSFAPIEGIAEGIFLPLFLLMVPMHAIIVMAFLIHQIGRNVIAHSGHELMPPGFTRLPLTAWLTTATHHDLHHSSGNHNFGLYFTWWDRWMKTEHPDYHEAFEAAAIPWDRTAKPTSTRD